jgi:hypothetical protein
MKKLLIAIHNFPLLWEWDGVVELAHASLAVSRTQGANQRANHLGSPPLKPGGYRHDG